MTATALLMYVLSLIGLDFDREALRPDRVCPETSTSRQAGEPCMGALKGSDDASRRRISNGF